MDVDLKIPRASYGPRRSRVARWRERKSNRPRVVQRTIAGRALPVVVAVRRRVRVEMRSEGGVADGSAGVPSKAEADTAEPVVAVLVRLSCRVS